jgi:hypothetical protein
MMLAMQVMMVPMVFVDWRHSDKISLVHVPQHPVSWDITTYYPKRLIMSYRLVRISCLMMLMLMMITMMVLSLLEGYDHTDRIMRHHDMMELIEMMEISNEAKLELTMMIMMMRTRMRMLMMSILMIMRFDVAADDNNRAALWPNVLKTEVNLAEENSSLPQMTLLLLDSMKYELEQ